MKLSAKTSVSVEVGLTPRLKAQLRVKAQEHASLSRQIAELKEKQESIKVFVERTFVNAEEGDALMDGVDIEGYKFRMVCGTTQRLDKKQLVELGCDPEWITTATKSTPNKPYIRLTPPGAKED